MSAHESLEIELKFDVDPGLPVPDLRPLVGDGSLTAPQRYELAATYLDTETHELAARRITLRRRTGGTDAGWHLKRPGGSATVRRERTVDFTLAPAADGVPEQIRAAILAIVRDRPLIPIAEITTERTVTVLTDADGVSLAEFCEDRVISHAHQSQTTKEWSEWEFELTGGNTQLLKSAKKLLRAAGARKASSASKLAHAIGAEPHTHRPRALAKKPTGADLVLHYLATHRDLLLQWDPGVREEAADSIHQMRVNARKLRSVLSAFPGVLSPERTAPLAADLRSLGNLLGDARDREVQLAINASLLDGEDEVPDDLRAALIDDEVARQQRALRSVHYALSTSRYLRMLDDLDELITVPALGPEADRPAAEIAMTGIDAARRRLRKAERTLSSFEPWSPEWVEQVHRIRKRGKAVRYIADTAKPLRLKEAARVARHAATIQSHLGDFQDTVANRSRLAAVAADPALQSRAQFVLGRLDAREEARGVAAVQAYLDSR